MRLLDRLLPLGCELRDEPPPARIVDDARQDGVAADAEGAELAREIPGHPVHRALGGDVGGSERHAHPGGRGRDVDDRASAARLHRRHGALDAVEHAVEIDVDHPVPVVVLDLVDRRARSADAGIVHQHVEAAERRQPLLEPARDRLA